MNERAQLIASGKLDDEQPSYEEMVAWLGRFSPSQLPSLLAVTTKLCLCREVFNDGMLPKFVQGVIDAAPPTTEAQRQELIRQGILWP